MRAKVAKKIERMVPDDIAEGRKEKKRAWMKLDWKGRAKISALYRKGLTAPVN